MIAALTVAVALAGGCPSEPLTKAGVLAAERDWVDALARGDGERLNCRLASGFTDSNWQGKLQSRADAMAGIAGPRPHLSLTELEVELLGRTAIVHGLNTQSQANGTIVGTVRFTDVFVYRAGRWQAISAQETLGRK